MNALERGLKYPTFNIRIKNEKGKAFIFDEVRKKWVLLTPEEWVRQHVVNYLVHHKNVPASLISVEKEIKLNETKKRYDAVVYKNMLPVMLIECKSPDVPITEKTLDQALRYNIILGVKFLLITNGLTQYVIKVENGKGKFIEDAPDFSVF